MTDNLSTAKLYCTWAAIPVPQSGDPYPLASGVLHIWTRTSDPLPREECEQIIASAQRHNPAMFYDIRECENHGQ